MKGSTGRSLSADYLKRSQRILQSYTIDNDGLIVPPEEETSNKHYRYPRNHRLQSRMNVSHINNHIHDKELQTNFLEKRNHDINRIHASPSPRERREQSQERNHLLSRKFSENSSSIDQDQHHRQHQQSKKEANENGSHFHPSSRPIPPNMKALPHSKFQKLSDLPLLSSDDTLRPDDITPTSSSQHRKNGLPMRNLPLNSDNEISESIISPIEQLRVKSPASPPSIELDRISPARSHLSTSFQRVNMRQSDEQVGKRLTVNEILHSQVIHEDIEIDYPTLHSAVDKFYRTLQNRANNRIEAFKKRLDITRSKNH